MGMYTELHFNSRLRQDVPDIVINTLEYMVEASNIGLGELPEHELFKTDRWPMMLRMDSAYFDADTHSTLRYDHLGKQYYLCIRTNLKNYDNEIEKFIDWIMPYLDKIEGDVLFKGDFLGFYRYEESEDPTLIHMTK